MTAISSVSQLIARIILGVILVAHGWQKFSAGIGNTVTGFEQMGVPAAGLAAPAVATVELVGGILLILGLGTRIVGIIVALVMLGAAIFAHLPNGIFAQNGGWELVGAIGTSALLLAGTGAGALSIDAILGKRRNANDHTETAGSTAVTA
ncbi:DoxX family protein [Corynebacterium tapiri]|uniref:DoxX family protein n=1 Tax=Corynebacterium tapiri TaxID=1448266 RepID=A0A5C4U4W2_9CORY|nr:DoxX family protein [Corynebacterium tapiri]TNL97279.1 DoxX family protein [Corynebacterium tapiri]